jgi:hypothetical protein
MIAVLDECRAAANLKNENKPSICDYYENIAVNIFEFVCCYLIPMNESIILVLGSKMLD